MFFTVQLFFFGQMNRRHRRLVRKKLFFKLGKKLLKKKFENFSNSKIEKKNLTKYQTVIHFEFISLIQSFFISTTTLESENEKNVNEILKKWAFLRKTHAQSYFNIILLIRIQLKIPTTSTHHPYTLIHIIFKSLAISCP
jgi:hypothetical protein